MKFLKVVLYFYEGILGGFQKEKPEEFLKKYLKELLNETLEKLKKGKFLKKSQKDLISQRFLCLYCGLKMKTNKRSFIHEGAKFEKKHIAGEMFNIIKEILITRMEAQTLYYSHGLFFYIGAKMFDVSFTPF